MWWKYGQNGNYSLVEEGKHRSDTVTLDDNEKHTTPSFLMSLDALMRLICVFMFIAGAVMLASARGIRETDVQCTKQLSVWCE